MTFNILKYREINDFIEKNTLKNNKKASIIAISKSKPLISVREAINNGIRIFGENRVQEAKAKFSDLKKEHKDIELHLTGPLQTNKVKSAINIFDFFHTLDREKLALEFNKHLENTNNKKFFIQINIGSEDQKSGISINESNDFIKFCINDLKMNVVGLMCIPPINDDPMIYFSSLKDIAKKNNLKQLSMGMSADYKNAILAGASYIRIGTLIFGERH
tara:strand:+ start:2356 stop:3009 length:654 start_codon:yes stop_codon:yes gene_type:complete